MVPDESTARRFVQSVFTLEEWVAGNSDLLGEKRDGGSTHGHLIVVGLEEAQHGLVVVHRIFNSGRTFVLQFETFS